MLILFKMIQCNFLQDAFAVYRSHFPPVCSIGPHLAEICKNYIVLILYPLEAQKSDSQEDS